MNYKKIETSRPTSNELIRLSEGDDVWLLKRYQGKNAALHRDSERERLSLWDRNGFLVPKVIALELAHEDHPYLVIQWLNGEPLNEYLVNNKQDVGIKLEKLKSLIKLIHDRQERCQRENNCDFVHHDPNTGNIILVDDKFYFIDFEASTHSQYNVTEALAIELAKFLRWASRDLGREYLNDIIQMVVEIYSPVNPILKRVVNRVHERRFQFIHRWKDNNKKLKTPGDVTKYDIANEIFFLLR